MELLFKLLKSVFTKFNHPRGRIRFIVLSILIFIFWNYFYFFTLTTAVIYLVLLIIFAVIAYKSIDNTILFNKYKLNQLEEIISQGKALDNPDLFNNKLWYLIDTKEKMDYLSLKADYHEQRREYPKAYKSYLQIDKLKLSEEENVRIKLNKALSLFEMGAYKKADLIMDDIKKNLDQLEAKRLGFYYNLKAFIVEKKDLDLTKALSLLQKAKDYISDLDEEHTLKAQLYNNFGRIRRLQNNLTDARSYYKKAKKHAVKSNEASLIVGIFDNLITIYSAQGEYDLLERTKQEYLSLLNDNLFTREEKMNLQLSIARNNLSLSDYKSFLIDSYFLNRQGLDKEKLLIFNATTLRLMYNSGLNAQMVADQIAKNIDDYFKFSMPDKFLLLHEIEIFMRNKNNLKGFYGKRQAPIQPNFKLENAIKMKEKVENYMQNEAVADIGNYLNSLKDYQVQQRLEFLQHKIGVITNHYEPYDFDSVYNLFLDLIDICKINGLREKEIETELNLVDEVLGLMDKEYGDKSKFRGIILSHLKNLDQSLSELEIISYFDINYIRMSYYYLSQGEVEKAAEYFDIVKSLELNHRNYSNWIKFQLREVYGYFDKAVFDNHSN
jgi:tetratricopeptide (TPR) repeat protein